MKIKTMIHLRKKAPKKPICPSSQKSSGLIRRNPLGTTLLILTFSVFLITFTIMSLQGLLMYLYWKVLYQADVHMPKFWRPIPLLAVLSALTGGALTLALTRIPLRPIRRLIDAINQLADGNFQVRIHLGLNRELIDLSDSFNRMAQELENTELLRSDFINSFSHEFKTPIVSLRGFARILKNDNLTKEERDEYLDIIIWESDRLAQLSTNILNLSKIEKISILSDMESFDLPEEIRQALLLFQTKWQKKELDLNIDLDEMQYYGNRDLLNQVWINLIDNAIKFSPKGGSLGLSLKRCENQVIFRIKDQGLGMDQETQSHIFDRFYQGDSSRTTEGNGVGLTVVDKIIRLHKGQIQVKSEPGKGADFAVILPAFPQNKKAQHNGQT